MTDSGVMTDALGSKIYLVFFTLRKKRHASLALYSVAYT